MLLRDILEWRPLKALLRRPAFPLALQALALLAAAALAWAGWGVGVNEAPKALLTLRKTNLATLGVWGVWWPLMIALALLAGRVWCLACPMEFLSRLGEALGDRARTRHLRLRAWMRRGWFILLGYALLQALVAGLSLHRRPHATTLLLLGLGLLALLSGLLIREGRAFCRSLCPAAALLSAYGRSTPLQLGKRSASVCADCRTRECIDPDRRSRLDARSCPSYLRPFDRRPSDGCVLCLQCVKACPHDNLGWGPAEPGCGARGAALLAPFEAAFVLIAGGFVLHELAGEWPALERAFHAAPEALHRLWPRPAPEWVEAAWFLALFPALFWGLLAALDRLAGARAPLRTRLLGIATGAVPIVASAHLAKALAKVGGWAPYLRLSLLDPQGLATQGALGTGALPLPAPWWGLRGAALSALLLMAGLAWAGLRAKASSLPEARSQRLGLGAALLLFGPILLIWALRG